MSFVPKLSPETTYCMQYICFPLHHDREALTA
jgi:hypothetical protein